MAQNLSVTFTLAMVKEQVRKITDTYSIQESLLLDAELAEFIHQAVEEVRVMRAADLIDFYNERKTDVTFTGSTPDFTASITALSIVDIGSITLYHATLGNIPLVSNERFNWLRANYTATEVSTTKGVGTVYLTTATPAVLTIGLFSNAAAAPTSVQIVYSRNPRKVTTDADTIDVPDQFVNDVIDATVKRILATKQVASASIA